MNNDFTPKRLESCEMYKGTKSKTFCYGTVVVPPLLHIVNTAILANAGEDQKGISRWSSSESEVGTYR